MGAVQSYTDSAGSAGKSLKTIGGELMRVSITKAGSADAVVQIYDNAVGDTSGQKLFDLGGAITGPFECGDSNGHGAIAVKGITFVSTGTTKAQVLVHYI